MGRYFLFAVATLEFGAGFSFLWNREWRSGIVWMCYGLASLILMGTTK